jgi:hypothetical protein
MDFSTRPRPRATGLDRLLAIVGAGALAASLLGAYRARADAEEARLSLAAVQQDTRRAEERIQGGGRASEAERLGLRAALNAEAPVARVLAELTSLMPEDVRLRSLEVTYDAEVGLVAQVEARSVSAWDAFLDRLAASKRFARVEPGPEARQGELRVSVRMVYRAAS